jgi:glycosyltransferase involved in cell wall biosynthesis
MKAEYQSTAVIIPALNAEVTLPPLLQALRQFFAAEQIIVVNDGSSDETAGVANAAHAIVIQHRLNQGKGAALESGFRFVRRQPQFRFALTMDADLQHLPSDVPNLFEEQRTSKAAIVVGARRRFAVGMPLARILSNTITSSLVSIRTGISIPDSQCGFRLIRRDVIENIFLQSSGYEAETEFLIKAAKRSYPISSAPIQTVYGSERSYMTHATTTGKFLKTLSRKY